MFKNITVKSNNGTIFFNGITYTNKCLLNAMGNALGLDPAHFLRMNGDLCHHRMLDFANNNDLSIIKEITNRLYVSLRVFAGVRFDDVLYINSSQYIKIGNSVQIIDIVCTGNHFMHITSIDDLYIPSLNKEVYDFQTLRFQLKESERLENESRSKKLIVKQIESDRLLAYQLSNGHY